MMRWLALSAALAGPATATELDVTVSGVKNATGQVRLALYDDGNLPRRAQGPRGG